MNCTFSLHGSCQHLFAYTFHLHSRFVLQWSDGFLVTQRRSRRDQAQVPCFSARGRYRCNATRNTILPTSIGRCLKYSPTGGARSCSVAISDDAKLRQISAFTIVCFSRVGVAKKDCCWFAKRMRPLPTFCPSLYAYVTDRNALTGHYVSFASFVLPYLALRHIELLLMENVK